MPGSVTGYPVDVLESQYDLFLHNDSFTIKLTNTTIPDPSRIWEDYNGDIYVDGNETSGCFSQLVSQNDYTKAGAGTINLVESGSGEYYLLGDFDNLPAHSYHAWSEETNFIYHAQSPFMSAEVQEDPILGVSEQEDVILITNTETGVTKPVPDETFSRQMRSGALTFAIHIRQYE